MTKMKLRKGDTVIVNSGTEKGKKGKILEISLKDNKVLVEGINVRIIHSKARRAGEESGIIKREKMIDASKVNYFCEKCSKGVKLGIKEDKDGNKSRFCRKCNEVK